MIFSMGMFPIVRRKNNSSIVLFDITLRDGNSKSSLPKRKGWVGCVVVMYLFRVSWVWSCRAAISLKSWRGLESAGDEDGLDEPSSLRESNAGRSMSVRWSFDYARWSVANLEYIHVLNSTMALRQAYSWRSTWSCLNFARVSWNAFTSFASVAAFSASA